MIHELKTWPDPFQAVWFRQKTHEIRVNDRDYKVDDVLRLREYDPSNGRYSGREMFVRVSYLSLGPDWGLPEGLCVMSVRPIPPELAT